MRRGSAGLPWRPWCGDSPLLPRRCRLQMASPRAPLNINDLPEDVLSRVLSKLDTRER